MCASAERRGCVKVAAVVATAMRFARLVERFCDGREECAAAHGCEVRDEELC